MSYKGAPMTRFEARPLDRPHPGRNLTAALIHDLASRISRAELPPGGQLPTERELMHAYGVSRTVVREAISSLRAEGLVVTHQGKGAFVSREGPRTPFRIADAERLTLQDVLRVMEVRIGLEVDMAALAAQRRTAAHLSAMRAALAEIESSADAADRSVNADLEFHLLVAQATGNDYFVALLRQLGPLLIPRARVDTFKHDSDGLGAYLRRVNQEHEQVLQSIARGDADGARAAMRVHLLNGRERMRTAFDAAAGER
jgi:GntR family transcriptional repressor for pyruvate dehydrogenase complex